MNHVLTFLAVGGSVGLAYLAFACWMISGRKRETAQDQFLDLGADHIPYLTK